MTDREPITAEQLSAFRARVQAAHDEVERGVILGEAWQMHAAYTGNPATVLELLDELEQARARIAELEQRPAIATVEDLDALPVGTVILDVDLADDPDDPAILVSQKTWASSRWPAPASTGWRKVGSVDVVSAAQLASSDAARFYVLWPRDVGPCDTAGLRGLPLGYLPVMEWHDGWAIRGQVTDWATAAETSRREAGTAPEFRHVVAELREVSDR